MKILVLTFYYAPDLCAGSFRNTPLVEKLAERLGEQDEVTVVTTMPNRYNSYKVDAQAFEQKGKLTIHRIALPDHNSGMKSQIQAFRKYYSEAQRIAANTSFDMVYASSSRLFTAFLGARLSRRYSVPLYLDIRDIFRETIADVLRNKLARPILNQVIRLIEDYTFSTARHINLVSEGFREYFAKYKQANFSFYTNGIDDIFLQQAPDMDRKQGSPVYITYAGNIGEGQGLHVVVPEMAKVLGNNYRIRIIGDGGASAKLKQAIADSGVSNVEVLAPVNRQRVIDFYRSSDYLFVHLNDLPAFEKVLPSKIFEYGCFTQPMIAGVSGYARKFLDAYVENVIAFDPGKGSEAAAAIQKYQYKLSDRQSFKEQFSRDGITEKIVTSIIKTGSKQ